MAVVTVVVREVSDQRAALSPHQNSRLRSFTGTTGISRSGLLWTHICWLPIKGILRLPLGTFVSDTMPTNGMLLPAQIIRTAQ